MSGSRWISTRAALQGSGPRAITMTAACNRAHEPPLRAIADWPVAARNVVGFALGWLLILDGTLLADDAANSTGIQTAEAPARVFANPQRVTIPGYSQDAMEPFITRDGTPCFSTTPTTRKSTPTCIGRVASMT